MAAELSGRENAAARPVADGRDGDGEQRRDLLGSQEVRSCQTPGWTATEVLGDVLVHDALLGTGWRCVARLQAHGSRSLVRCAASHVQRLAKPHTPV